MAPPIEWAILARLKERLGIDPWVQWTRDPATLELMPVTVVLRWDDFLALAMPHLGEEKDA